MADVIGDPVRTISTTSCRPADAITVTAGESGGAKQSLCARVGGVDHRFIRQAASKPVGEFDGVQPTRRGLVECARMGIRQALSCHARASMAPAPAGRPRSGAILAKIQNGYSETLTLTVPKPPEPSADRCCDHFHERSAFFGKPHRNGPEADMLMHARALARERKGVEAAVASTVSDGLVSETIWDLLQEGLAPDPGPARGRRLPLRP